MSNEIAARRSNAMTAAMSASTSLSNSQEELRGQTWASDQAVSDLTDMLVADQTAAGTYSQNDPSLRAGGIDGSSVGQNYSSQRGQFIGSTRSAPGMDDQLAMSQGVPGRITSSQESVAGFNLDRDSLYAGHRSGDFNSAETHPRAELDVRSQTWSSGIEPVSSAVATADDDISHIPKARSVADYVAESNAAAEKGRQRRPVPVTTYGMSYYGGFGQPNNGASVNDNRPSASAPSTPIPGGFGDASINSDGLRVPLGGRNR